MANLGSDDQGNSADSGGSRSWWLAGGSEYCFACEAPAEPEGLAYCVACDQAVCALCRQGAPDRVGALCPECAASAGDEP